MPAYISAAFNNGFVARPLDVVRGATESGSPLDDEVARFTRVVTRGCGSVPWALPAATVAATLDLISLRLAAGIRSDLPVGFEDGLRRAAGATPDVALLAELAVLVRRADRHGVRDFAELPMSGWEMEVMFAGVRAFGYWVETDEYASLDDCVRAGIGSMHPHECADGLILLAAQAQEALVLFPDPAVLRRTLGPVIPWASSEVFRMIRDEVQLHFREQH
jgi:hypothetical protein